MADPNLADFYKRVERIERARSQGYGFEAAGTLGRSHFHRPSTPRRAVVGPMALFLGAVLMVKGLMINEIGAEDYAARIALLDQSESGIERAGGWMMQADPVSLWIAAKIAALKAERT